MVDGFAGAGIEEYAFPVSSNDFVPTEVEKPPDADSKVHGRMYCLSIGIGTVFAGVRLTEL